MLTRKQNLFGLFAFVVFIFPINCQNQDRMVYILIWTVTFGEDWIYRGLDGEEGQEAFVKRKCSFQNCYMTTNRTYFKSVLDFDVLLFSAVHISRDYRKVDMPFERSEQQLYVFFSIEPAAYNSIAHYYFINLFNVTWTYLLKSDIVCPYFFVKNVLGEVVAPRTHVHWTNIKDMAPINKTIERKLKFKSIAAMWVVSNCAPKRRLIFVQSLNYELSKYGQRVDIYGRCGDQTNCQRFHKNRNGVLTSCFPKIESDYYFYLAFENSFTEDYITEKVLHGLLHFSVPIVYGGANYTRFMPNGIYLNALKLGVKGLAKEMINIMNNSQRYYDFFKWHNHYHFQDAGADDYRDSVCAFCAFLNKETRAFKRSIYHDIIRWWNAPRPDEFPNTPRPVVTSSLLPPKMHEENVEMGNEKNTNSILTSAIDFFLNGE